MSRVMDNFRIGSGKDFLPEGSLQRLPSVVAQSKIPTASRAYNMFSTTHLVDTLAKENWLPVFAQEQRVRNEDKAGYQKHMIRFRQPNSTFTHVGDIAPELTVTNAHDTTAAFLLLGGFWKLACLNGLVVCQSEIGTLRVRHVGYDEGYVLESVSKLSKDISALTEKVKGYQGITLNLEEQRLFAEEALELKFGDAPVAREGKEDEVMIGERGFSISAFLYPNRAEDRAPTLWNIFNRIQEKCIKGNTFERTWITTNSGQTIYRSKVREVQAINENLRINQGLWTLLELFRVMKEGK